MPTVDPNAVDMDAVAAALRVDAGGASARALRERELPELVVSAQGTPRGNGGMPGLFDKADAGVGEEAVEEAAEAAADGPGVPPPPPGSQAPTPSKLKMKKKPVAGIKGATPR